MKNISVLLIAVFMSFSFTASAATQDFSFGAYAPSMDNAAGVRAMVTGVSKNGTLIRGGVNLSQNLGGPDISIGKKLGRLKLFTGVTWVTLYEPINIMAPVNNQLVSTKTRHGVGGSIYIEAGYKNLFVRYSSYDVDLDYTALLSVSPTENYAAPGTVNHSGSVYWLGFNLPIK